jgi:glycyl-tRNA synthetase (class II)
VTVRDRDTAQQVRVPIRDLEDLIFKDMYRDM